MKKVFLQKYNDMNEVCSEKLDGRNFSKFNFFLLRPNGVAVLIKFLNGY